MKAPTEQELREYAASERNNFELLNKIFERDPANAAEDAAHARRVEITAQALDRWANDLASKPDVPHSDYEGLTSHCG